MTGTSLHYAVRIRALAKYLGLIALMLATLTLLPLLISLLFADYTISSRYVLVIALLLALGLPSLRLQHPADLQVNEALTITALAFILAPLVMSYPMMAGGLSFMDAWFEAVSAVTTTGLSTVADIESMPRSFVFARAWMQWYGGLGIVVFSVAILLNHSIALRRLVSPTGESMLTTTRIYARRTLAVYTVLTLMGVILLAWLMEDAFMAMVHTLSALSTGGFSPYQGSLTGLSVPVQFAVVSLGMMGAIPFILYYRLVRGGWREMWGDVELRALLLVTLLVSVLLSLSMSLLDGMDGAGALLHGALQGISAQTTTGFSSLDIGQLSNASLGLMVVAMLIGGGVGSTAGGFKVLRLLIFLRLVQLLIQRTAMPPHAVNEPRLGGRALEGEEIERALVLILIFIGVVIVSWLVFLFYGYEPLPALFEVVSATATVGLSVGITDTDLKPLLKGLLALNMLLGRLEMMALLIVLYPGTWLGKRTE